MVEQVNAGDIKVGSEQVEKAIKAVTELVERLDRLNGTITKAVRPAQQKSQAINNMARSAQKTTTAMQTFNKSSQDLTKSVQVALGPLSGVAARITALTALFNRNTFAAAALIGAFTGFIVATKKLTHFAIETETALLRMDAVVRSLGDRAAFTADQLEGMAQSLARSTLASVSEAREAVTTLATFGNIAPEAFEKATRAAYAFADVLGGQLGSSVRQIGVLLEDPVRNMEMLRRRGIQFTQAEREKIDILMRSGRTLEAQNEVLEKFNIFMGQSEEKAKLLGGTLDGTTQLLNNFFQAVAESAGLTSKLNEQFEKTNNALKGLLENEQFIHTWGTAFRVAAETVARALKVVTENIAEITAVMAFFLTIVAIRSATALTLFAANVVASSRSVRLLRVAMIRLSRATSIATVKVALFGTATKIALGPIALFVAAISAATWIYIKFTRTLDDSLPAVERLDQRIKEMKASLDGLPQTVQLRFESNANEIRGQITQLELERQRLEVMRLRAEKRTSGMVMVGPGEFVEIPDDPLVDSLTGQIADLERQIKEAEDSLLSMMETTKRYGQLDISGVLNNFRELEESFFPDLAEARKKADQLTILWNLLEDVALQTALGISLIDAGIDEERILAVIDAVERGKDTADKAADSWKNLANTFSDLQFDIEQTTNELLGVEKALQINPRTLRQFEELTSGERVKLEGMGINPQTLTESQQLLQDINDLSREMNRIQQDQMSEAEKINAQYENTIALIERMTHLNSENRDVLREQADLHMHRTITEPLRDIEKQVQEQQKLNSALSMGEESYRRMRNEIETTNKVEQYRLHLMQLNAPNAEEQLKQFEKQIRLMASLRDQYDKMNEDLQRYKDLAQDLGSVIANSFEDAIVAGNGLRDVLQGLLDDLLRIATRVMITKPLESAFVEMMGGMGGNLSGISGVNRGSQQDLMLASQNFAKGGIMSGQGSLPLHRYASGGIARTPQLAMFGEGSTNEAYVPLPDGRTIPVTMKGGSNVQVNIVNNVGAEVKTNVTEGAHGTSIDVMIDRAVAEKLADQGSSSNRSLRTAFGAKNTLTGR